MAEAAAALPRAPIYGIGTYSTGSGIADFEIGWDEFARDTEWAHSMMVEAGIARGDLVLFSAPNHENPWVTPIVRALRRIGAPYVTAETYGWDSRRLAMYLKRLPIKAVVGLSKETVEALADPEGTLSTLLSDVSIVWARAEAVPRLDALEIQVATYLPLGPALGLGMPGERGARVNGDEWTVFEDGGRVHVTNKRPRATTFDAVDTGVSGVATKTGGDFRVFPAQIPIRSRSRS
jgi:hypothetical protein